MAFAEALTKWQQQVDKDLNFHLEDINRKKLKLAEEEAKVRAELQTPKDPRGIEFEAKYTNAVSDYADQKRIYEELVAMKDIGPEPLSHTGSLFFHADNIRYVCQKAGHAVPKWFSDKYGHLFEKEF
jgi:hypothetical protein